MKKQLEAIAEEVAAEGGCTSEVEKVAQVLLAYSKRDSNALFKLVSLGLRMRLMLNPEDDLAVNIAALAITRRVLELREEKRGGKAVVA